MTSNGYNDVRLILHLLWYRDLSDWYYTCCDITGTCQTDIIPVVMSQGLVRLILHLLWCHRDLSDWYYICCDVTGTCQTDITSVVVLDCWLTDVRCSLCGQWCLNGISCLLGWFVYWYVRLYRPQYYKTFTLHIKVALYYVLNAWFSQLC